MKSLILFFILIFPSLLWSAESTESKIDYSEIARKRTYIGGVDESNLKLQDPLPVPLKKLNQKSIEENVYKKYFKQEESDKKQKSKG